MRYTQSADDLSLRNPHRWSTVIVSKYGVNVGRRILDTGFVKLKRVIYTYLYKYSNLFYHSIYKEVQ